MVFCTSSILDVDAGNTGDYVLSYDLFCAFWMWGTNPECCRHSFQHVVSCLHCLWHSWCVGLKSAVGHYVIPRIFWFFLIGTGVLSIFIVRGVFTSLVHSVHKVKSVLLSIFPEIYFSFSQPLTICKDRSWTGHVALGYYSQMVGSCSRQLRILVRWRLWYVPEEEVVLLVWSRK